MSNGETLLRDVRQLDVETGVQRMWHADTKGRYQVTKSRIDRAKRRHAEDRATPSPQGAFTQEEWLKASRQLDEHAVIKDYIAFRERVALTLKTFYTAPLSLSSVQPLLALALELNPELVERRR